MSIQNSKAIDTLIKMCDVAKEDKTLQRIEKILKEHTAFSYAEYVLECKKEILKTRGEDYFYHLSQMYGNSDEALEVLEERMRISAIKHYGDYTSKYAGFYDNGKVFILNKKEKFVSILFEKNNKTNSVHLLTHYNPLLIDCIQHSITSSYVFNNESCYDYSQNEEELIRECDRLIIEEEKAREEKFKTITKSNK